MKRIVKSIHWLIVLLYVCSLSLAGIQLAPPVYAANGYVDPNADGSIGSWNTTGVSRYTEIDEAVRQPNIPTTTDNIYGTAAGTGNYFARMGTFGGVYRATQITVWIYHNDGANGQIRVRPYNDDEVTPYAAQQTVTARNVNTWDSITFSGFDLTQAQLDALSIRLNTIKGTGAGSTVYVYAMYADITYSVPPTFEQSAYRLFLNRNGTNVNAPLAAQDINAVLSSTGQAFRLRTLIHVGLSNVPANAETFKLQYVDRGNGSCSTPSGGTPASYTDVLTSTAISYYDNATPADGANLTANANDPVHQGHAKNIQTYEETNNFINSRAAIVAGNDGMWDFALYDNGASAATTFCFRVTKSDGTLLNTYSVYPQVTTAGGTLSADIVDAGGTPVGAPAYAMSTTTTAFTCQTATTTIGTATQKLRLTNNTTNVAWSLAIAATGGATSNWTTGSVSYDFNDPSGSPAGCADGAGDADSLAGQLSLNPSVETVTPRSGCDNTGVSVGSSSAFNQGVVNSITLASASSSAFTSCYWDITGITGSQTIPPEQADGTYSINLTITATAV